MTTDKRLKALESRLNSLYSAAFRKIKELLAELDLDHLFTLKAAERLASLNSADFQKVVKKIVAVLIDATTAGRKETKTARNKVFKSTYKGEKSPKLAENPFISLSRIYIAAAVYNDIFGAILTGILGGEPRQKISERLKHLTERTLSGAIANARSELTRAHNAATLANGQDLEQHGEKALKRWIAVLDDRTRPDHAAMDGITLPLEEPFTLHDGSKMMYPCDISFGAPLSQIINCRCKIEIVKQG